MKCKNQLPSDFDYAQFKYGDQVSVETAITPAKDGSANVAIVKMQKIKA